MINMHPKNLEDIIAVIALYRPGPMDFIPGYLKNRQDPEHIKYHCPELKPILDVTYGTIVYQEQVMQIFRDLAGYSLGASDMVRRAVAKKQADVLAAQRKFFLYGSDGNDGGSKCDGCLKRGISAEAANAIFDDMASFASYAFNKSHSAAYALVTYQTAWLRCYYPQEFMAAMLTSVLDNTDKVVGYITECQTGLGFQVLPPSVNESMEKFTVVGDNIRFGLLAIKNLGSGIINTIINEREQNGKFDSYYSFCKRCYGKDFNKRALENLIKSGAVDCFGLNRNQMLMMIDDIITDLDNDKKNKIDGQIGMFDLGSSLAKAVEIPAPDVPEMPQKEKLAFEKQTTGLYMSGHPVAEHMKLSQMLGCAKTSDIVESTPTDPDSAYKDGEEIQILCIIATLRKKITKNNTTMAFLSVEDVYGSVEVLVFPKNYDKNAEALVEDSIVLLKAKVSLRDDEVAKLLCEEVTPLDQIDDDSVLLEKYKLPEKEYKTYRSAISVYESMSSAADPDDGFVPDESDFAYVPVYDDLPPANDTAPAPVIAKQIPKPKIAANQPYLEDIPERAPAAKVFLKVSSASGEDCYRAKKMCSIFGGSVPVVLYYSDTKSYDMNSGIRIEDVSSLFKGLNRLLGKDNVVIR